MRPKQIMLTGGVIFIVICLASLFRIGQSGTVVVDFSNPLHHSTAQHPEANAAPAVPRPPPPPPPAAPKPQEPVVPKKPMSAPAGAHPIAHLVQQAESDFKALGSRQSKTLAEAVIEYRRRYRMPPPPHFDKWFEFAQKKSVQLIDEFDMVYEAVTPFWGLKPATIRERAAEALGFDNALLGIQIRGGRITHFDGGSDWQQNATKGMIEKFIAWLPDMDLCFNLHDEPRVVVPHEDLSRLVHRAKDINMPTANSKSSWTNDFTKHPKGLNDGLQFAESKRTRFNVFAHQPTWTHSRLSCSPDSPARGLEEDELQDDLSRYGLGELGFIYNVTAMQDICYSPSLRSSFGFFDRPNAFNIVHDLFPIFSQSKVSSFSDILYPSPWYWWEKVSYESGRDMAWSKKNNSMYWRGSTTGGFSRNGGWRRQHRQHFVKKINAKDNAKILVNTGNQWEPKEVPRGQHRDLIDVQFSHIGQCDPGDCAAQQEFFQVSGRVDQQDAWGSKYLVDLDGNAFSGRFYAFLRSKSLIYKFAIFKEWHLEWLKPWVHYIPLSLQGEEWLEAVRYFATGAVEQKEAERLALQQREWANKVLRHEDMEVWFFRLLLEYGRVIDDNRNDIGYSA
ncbi:glycosyltransferase family 90 protein [Microdochium bolleyi]|uniref:Glycosyltransferase family 90 protein n=1 Tax=Microdochium bolleyi TaxID=196109 RepID=A0A136JBP5_9PEZI|nr:glycosyltransferase family 90 protein [Microdochium bolleyi]